MIHPAKKIDLVDSKSKDTGQSYNFKKKVINQSTLTSRRRVAKYHRVSVRCPKFRNYDVSPVWIKRKILIKLESDCKITRTRGSPEFFRFVSLTHLSPVLNRT